MIRVISILISHCCAQLLSHAQLFWDPMDCSPPGFSVHRISQARILEWVAISYSRGPSQPRDWTHVSCIFCTGRWILYHYQFLIMQIKLMSTNKGQNSRVSRNLKDNLIQTSVLWIRTVIQVPDFSVCSLLLLQQTVWGRKEGWSWFTQSLSPKGILSRLGLPQGTWKGYLRTNWQKKKNIQLSPSR